MSPGQYSECWLFLHILNEDWGAANELLAQFNKSERAALYEANRALKGALIDGVFHDMSDAPEPFPRKLADEEANQ